jgi:hypothetical protein
MPLSYAELKAKLDVDEPDYAALAEAATGAMQHLRKLAASPDVALASKAVSLAGIIGDADGVGIVGAAAKSAQALVRVAAAHAASLLPDTPQAARLVSGLLDDKDAGVLKLATRAAARVSDPGVAAKATRARVRMDAAVRAAQAPRGGVAGGKAMATKGKVKGSGAATVARSMRKGAAKARAGQMPSGAMAAPPKGAKAHAMPEGKM